jgi:hypothetical protein
MARTKGGKFTTKVNMYDQGKQGPSKDMAATPGSVQQKPMVHGSGLNDDVKIEPVTKGPNAGYAADGKLPDGSVWKSEIGTAKG